MPNDASSKNYLIVVHGMGEHTRDGVEAGVRNALDGLPGWDGSRVEVRAVAYNKIFDEWQARAKEDWSNTLGLLDGRVHFSRMKEVLEDAVKDDEAGIFQTQWLDVVLYMSTLGNRVQLEVAAQLTQILEEFYSGRNLDRRNCVIIGHSLGAAVTHDTLHKMWRGGFEDDRYNTLSRMPISINALFQVANTSRLLKSGIDPATRETAVRPVPGALMQRMYNVWHRYDPVARIKQFRIKNLDQWLAERQHPEHSYIDIELTGLHSLEVHTLAQYLQDPKVYVSLFQELFDGYQFPDDLQNLIEEHDKGVVQPGIEAFKQAVEESVATLDQIESISDVATTLQAIEKSVASGWSDLEATIRGLKS